MQKLLLIEHFDILFFCLPLRVNQGIRLSPLILFILKMEHFPQTLLSLLSAVSEQYGIFSWASQEQNCKMKITLTWTNEKTSRPKSKSTKKRDRKRIEQYKEQREKMNSDKENEKHHVSAKNEADENLTDSEYESESDMETVNDLNTPCRASTQVTNMIVENQSIACTPDVNQEACRDVSTIQDKNTVTFKDITVNNNIGEKSKTERITCDSKPKWPRRFFSKIILKTAKDNPPTLVGKIAKKDYVIVHIIERNTTMRIDPIHSLYERFEKNVRQDFKDVSETQFMNERVEDAIRKMEHFVEERRKTDKNF